MHLSPGKIPFARDFMTVCKIRSWITAALVAFVSLDFVLGEEVGGGHGGVKGMVVGGVAVIIFVVVVVVTVVVML